MLIVKAERNDEFSWILATHQTYCQIMKDVGVMRNIDSLCKYLSKCFIATKLTYNKWQSDCTCTIIKKTKMWRNFGCEWWSCVSQARCTSLSCTWYKSCPEFEALQRHRKIRKVLKQTTEQICANWANESKFYGDSLFSTVSGPRLDWSKVRSTKKIAELFWKYQNIRTAFQGKPEWAINDYARSIFDQRK